MPVLASLVVLEALLSVDNALVIAAMTNHLPSKQKLAASRIGLVGAYVFRIVLLVFANLLISNCWLKVAGAIYLIHLMCKNLGQSQDNTDNDQAKQGGFWTTVASVAVADMCFSMDNVLASTALSSQLWVVIVGVGLGILTMALVAGAFVKLMEKYPVLGRLAYVIVGYIGVLLILDQCAGLHVCEAGKFAGLVSIIVSGMIYSHSRALQIRLQPLLGFCRTSMGKVVDITDMFYQVSLNTAVRACAVSVSEQSR
jgi:YkoY family integral membrane protein